MKILSLRFANINALGGEWSIDFEDPVFRDGLFALTGPTGSGKTSVLDALSLALYGRTVRQRISKDANEVMTRGTGSARAEVTFESDGVRYLCTWSQHRARNKANGALQLAKRVLTRLDDSTTLCERLAEIDDEVARVTGMTFGQFTRSVLLAQGQFDAFLKARDDERSDILEQVTGTEIYSEIGAAVFSRYQREREETALLTQRRTVIQVLAPEARAALLHDLDEAHGRQAALTAEIVRLQRELAWLDARDALRTQKASLLKACMTHEEHLNQAGPALARLVRAETACTFDVAYAKLTAARQTAVRAEQDACARAETLQADLARQAALAPQMTAAAEAARAARQKWEQMLPVFQHVRNLDRQRAVADSELNAAEAAFSEAVRQEQHAREEARAAEKHLAVWREEQSAAAAVCMAQGNVPPAEAGHRYPLVQIALEKAQAVRDSETAQPALIAARDARDAAAKVKTDAEKTRDWRRPDLELALAGCRENVALTARMASLEEQRSLLQEGEPCPLCGATVHPFAAGEPLPRLVDAQKRLEETERRLKALDRQMETARKAADAAEDAFRRQERICQSLQEAITRTQTRFEVAQAELKSRIASGESSLAKQRAELAAWTETLVRCQTGRQRCALALEAATAERQALFEGDPDTGEQRLHAADLQAKETHDGLLAQQIRLEETLGNDRRECDAADTHRIETARAAADLTTGLSAEWSAAGFADEAQWSEARWTDEDRAQTRHLKETLAAEGNALKTRLTDTETALRQKEAENVTVRSREETADEQTEKQQILDALRQQAAERQAALKIDDEALAKQHEQATALEVQKARFAKWETLNGWLGGENGMRFKRYAQGITLRRLLRMANPHLARMTRDRYEMVWEPASQNLVPDIIDHEQGDVRRAVSNLSGGETFLASLALALGLATLASGRLQVESLFLDEGFGTLDDDALDTALDTLGGLQREGKLIGVISHVPAIRERIRTQIQIRPQAGGRSTLSGAGVSGGLRAI